uniref:ATP synthase complex subunit 8 n=1 Tax=Drilonius striatulus TaxID=341977 RepID=A0A0S2MR87_9COLE|nr:ATP synthase F0 subunit 8 [Drilonius striatulus]
MPQMAPMNWFILFITFSLTFFMFNTLNFFLYNINPSKSSESAKKNSFNWKW